MKSRLFVNLALLLIVAVLAAIAFLEPGKNKPEDHPLVAVDESGVSKISLKNTETIVFEKRDGHWRITAPFQAPANEVRIQQLIEISKANSEANYPLKPENLTQFELDKPKAELSLNDTTLTFGGSDPINMRRYVKSGDTLHLVSDDFFHHLVAPATDYVDKKLLPETARIREISIPGLKAKMGQDSKWVAEPGSDAKANVTEIAGAWSTARAIDVKRLDKPEQGDSIRIGLADAEPIEFVVLQREPDLLLARKDLGLQYELTGDAGRQLLNLPKPPEAEPPAMDVPDQEQDTAPPPPEDGEPEDAPDQEEPPTDSDLDAPAAEPPSAAAPGPADGKEEPAEPSGDEEATE